MGFFPGKLLCQVIIILLLKDLLGMRPHLLNTTLCPILLLERRYLQIANYIHNQLSYTCREAPKFVFFSFGHAWFINSSLASRIKKSVYSQSKSTVDQIQIRLCFILIGQVGHKFGLLCINAFLLCKLAIRKL